MAMVITFTTVNTATTKIHQMLSIIAVVVPVELLQLLSFSVVFVGVLFGAL